MAHWGAQRPHTRDEFSPEVTATRRVCPDGHGGSGSTTLSLSCSATQRQETCSVFPWMEISLWYKSTLSACFQTDPFACMCVWELSSDKRTEEMSVTTAGERNSIFRQIWILAAHSCTSRRRQRHRWCQEGCEGPPCLCRGCCLPPSRNNEHR